MTKTWTKKEISFIKKNYALMSNKELSLALNKTISSVSHKIFRLNLSKKQLRKEIFKPVDNKDGTYSIPLTGPKFRFKLATIDQRDLKLISKYFWYGNKKGKDIIYAATKINSKMIYMHNLIMQEKYIDHIDHNGLNNTRKNLRIATPQQNSFNSRKLKNTKNKYKGVYFHKICNKFQVQIQGKSIGYFKNEIDAAVVYDEKAKELFGEFACLNFPKQ